MSERGYNWHRIGACLATSPVLQRLALVLLGGAAVVGPSSPLPSACDLIERDAARQLWRLLVARGAIVSGDPHSVPEWSVDEVFEVLDALAAGLSVDEIALCLDLPAADVWAVLGSTF